MSKNQGDLRYYPKQIQKVTSHLKCLGNFDMLERLKTTINVKEEKMNTYQCIVNQLIEVWH